jgi:cell wall-associated NlpC family hydrolase
MTAARLAATTVGMAALLSPLPAFAADEVPPTPTSAVAAATPKKLATKTTAQRQRAKRIAAAKRADRKRASLVRVALNQKGDRYIAGHSGPGAFDCSGFTKYVYKKAAGKNLPHYSGAQMNRSKRVSRKHLKPGDLLFYGRGGSQHVSMYIGKGKMIHATNPRSGVRVDSINMGYYTARFAGAGRLVQS